MSIKIEKIAGGSLEDILNILTGKGSDRSKEAARKAEETPKLLSAAGYSEDEQKTLACVFASTRGDSFHEFMGRLRALAENDDNLMAAKLLFGISEYLYHAVQTLKMADTRAHTGFLDPEDEGSSKEGLDLAKGLLDRVQAKHTLARSLAN